MREIVRAFIVLMMSLAACSCATYSRHGDAVLEDNRQVSFPFTAFDQLNFPKIPLGQKAVYSYKVLDIPQEIYPQGFELINVPPDEDSSYLHNQPWRSCIIEASLVTLDGHTFFQKRLDFAHDWNGSGDATDLDHRKIWFQFTDYDFNTDKSSLPLHLSYVLRVSVIRPSLRSTDQLSVSTFTSLSRAKRGQ